MYTVDVETGLILSGFDVPEPAPFKPGSASLMLLGVASKIIAEPQRAIPAVTWLAYCYFVFFSTVLPGVPAQTLDPATWIEVRDLSINFWLVAPLLHLPIAANTLHPGLEAIFNLLLAWAAAFSGFLSDGRPGRPSGSMVPVVGGMQLLTNAVLLPYLVIRCPESGERVYIDDLSPVERTVGEWRALGPLLASVGSVALAWGCVARPEFGDLRTRFDSLLQFLSQDRVGSSFVIDLVLFSFFQGWLVDEDLGRRGIAPRDATFLRAVAKYVPFYGLCYYLSARPDLGEQSNPASKSARPS